MSVESVESEDSSADESSLSISISLSIPCSASPSLLTSKDPPAPKADSSSLYILATILIAGVLTCLEPLPLAPSTYELSFQIPWLSLLLTIDKLTCQILYVRCVSMIAIV